MGEANVTNATSRVITGAPKPRKPGNLTFGQRALLLVGITVLGGAPGYLMIRGSVPEQPRNSTGSSVVMNTAENARTISALCEVKEGFKPAINFQKATE